MAVSYDAAFYNQTAVANAEQKAAQNDKEPAEPKKASIKRTKSGHSQLEDEVETIVTESTPTVSLTTSLIAFMGGFIVD